MTLNDARKINQSAGRAFSHVDSPPPPSKKTETEGVVQKCSLLTWQNKVWIKTEIQKLPSPCGRELKTKGACINVPKPFYFVKSNNHERVLQCYRESAHYKDSFYTVKGICPLLVYVFIITGEYLKS